jgi:hypothetical protein
VLAKYSTVRTLAFTCDAADGTCRVTIALGTEPANLAQDISITFDGVAALSVRGFGGGMTQVMGLRVTDIRDQQHDRLNFEVNDLEDGKLSFRCRSFSLS